MFARITAPSLIVTPTLHASISLAGAARAGTTMAPARTARDASRAGRFDIGPPDPGREQGGASTHQLRILPLLGGEIRNCPGVRRACDLMPSGRARGGWTSAACA